VRARDGEGGREGVIKRQRGLEPFTERDSQRLIQRVRARETQKERLREREREREREIHIEREIS
jgi:hypothetical protein